MSFWWQRGRLLYVFPARDRGLAVHHLSEAFHLIYSAKGIPGAVLSVCTISRAGQVPTGDRDEAPGLKGCCLLAGGENRRAAILLPGLAASPWLLQRQSETE